MKRITPTTWGLVTCTTITLGACTPTPEVQKNTGGTEETGETEEVEVEVFEWDLRIRPLLPNNQPNLFDSVTRIDLLITDPDGELATVSLSDIGSGNTPRIEDLPPLEQAILTIQAFDSAGTLVTQGKTPPVDISGGEQTVRVLMGGVGTIGWFPELLNADGESRGVQAGGLLALGGGEFRLLGGTGRVNSSAGGSESADDGIWGLSIRNPGDALGFTRIADMVGPGTGSGGNGRAAHGTNLIVGDLPDAGLALISGGSTDFFDTLNATNQAALIDPLTGTLVETLELGDEIFQHNSLVDDFGRVVMSGGSTKSSGINTFSAHTRLFRYLPDTRELESIGLGSGEEPWIWHMAAPRNDGSVLFCGGATFTDMGTVDADPGCGLLSAGGSYIPRAETGISIPLKLVHASLSRLSDGSLILIGGFTPAIEGETTTWNVDGRIWRLESDGTSFEPIGALEIPRGQHSVQVLPDDSILVVGGTSTLDDPPFQSGVGGVACVERVEANGLSRLLSETCTAGSPDGDLQAPVSWPMMAADPETGEVLIVGGMGDRDFGQPEVSIYFP